MSRGLNAARQHRDKCWAEFRSACVDLEEEIEPSGAADVNQRRIKVKIELVTETYDSCLTASSQVWNLEKSSPTAEVNWNWVNTNLRKPRNTIVRKADDDES